MVVSCCNHVSHVRSSASSSLTLSHVPLFWWVLVLHTVTPLLLYHATHFSLLKFPKDLFLLLGLLWLWVWCFLCTPTKTHSTTSITSGEPRDRMPESSPRHTLAEASSYLFLPALRDIFDNHHAAVQKGQFQLINVDSIDLPPPRETPNPAASRLWINQLPAPFAQIFNLEHESYLTQPLAPYSTIGRLARTLPQPKVHASPQQYSQLLQRAESASMVRWSIVEEEDKSYTDLADSIQLTLFAVSKTQNRTRLISLPRVQNDALPDPPTLTFPTPRFSKRFKQTDQISPLSTWMWQTCSTTSYSRPGYPNCSPSKPSGPAT